MKLDHLVLMLGDLAASLPYYEALLPLLGFTRARGHDYVNADGLHIDLQQAGDPSHAYARQGVGLNHLGFAAPERASIDRIREAMAARGFPVPEVQHFGADVSLFMKDRDGIRFEVAWVAPGEAS
jgi:catechol 2,3-dioxygenase-like lactoylglutathione lyase family enzyme